MDQPALPSTRHFPLKTGEGPGLSSTRWTLGPVFLVAVPRGRGTGSRKVPLGVTPCPSPQSQGWSMPPPPSSPGPGRVRGARSLASLQPRAPEAPSLSSTLFQAQDLLRLKAVLNQIKEPARSVGKFEDSRQFSRVQHSRSVPCLRAQGVEEAERRIRCGGCCGPPGPAGSSGEAGAGEGRASGSPPPLKHLPGPHGPVLLWGERGGRGLSVPWLTQSYRTLTPGFLCLCHVPRRRGDPGPSPRPLPFAP